MKIKAVLFDLIGTTVKEKDPLFINKCLQKAFGLSGIEIALDCVIAQRGKDKKAIITNILNGLNLPADICEKILGDYTIILENGLDNFGEIDGLKEIISFLNSAGIKKGLGTGLPGSTLNKIMDHLKWDRDLFDYTAASEDIGIGRPDPAMIYDMMNKLNIGQDEFLKIGDTVSDIKEGRNAGVLTAVILSGTQDEKLLREQKPDYIVNSLIQIKDIIK